MKSQMARCFFAFLALFLLLITGSIGAQGKAPRIGFLVVGSAASVSSRVDAFREGLRERGYIEGKNIVIEYRYGDGKPDRMTNDSNPVGRGFVSSLARPAGNITGLTNLAQELSGK